MKHMVDSYKVVKDGKTIDEFIFYRDGNHASIYNKTACLFDGYHPEACGWWKDHLENDIPLIKMMGFEIVK